MNNLTVMEPRNANNQKRPSNYESSPFTEMEDDDQEILKAVLTGQFEQGLRQQ